MSRSCLLHRKALTLALAFHFIMPAHADDEDARWSMRDLSLEELYATDPDPIQGLETLFSRAGHKPYALYETEDGLKLVRVVFQDRQFGTTVWQIDDSPIFDPATTASMHPFWNANATRLLLPGNREFQGSTHAGWLANANYSEAIPAPARSRPIWDCTDPNRVYNHNDGQLQVTDIATGETRMIAQWDSFPRERIYGFTTDKRFLFLDTPNGGLFTSYNPGDIQVPRSGLHPGRPSAPDEHGNAVHPSQPSRVYNTNRNPAEVDRELGPLLRIRAGFLIDRETGEMQGVIVPASGNDDYLRAYMSGRVNFPEWEGFTVLNSDNLEELYELYAYFPIVSHGHETPSPDLEFFATDSNHTTIRRMRDNSVWQRIRPAYDGRNYHVHWFHHPRFFVGWIRGWRYWGAPAIARPTQYPNVVFQFFTDGTAQPIYDTKHQLNGFYPGGEFSMQSPDQTKIHSQSSMSGRIRTMIAVMARPRPPENPSWQETPEGVALSWEAPLFDREIQGYLVYRSDASGDGYALITPEPVEGYSFIDTTVVPGSPYYYVVSSLEHSGLESGYSAEVARAGLRLDTTITAPLTIYLEPERAIRDLYTDEMPGLSMGVDRWDASDWQFLYRHPQMDHGEASLVFNLDHPGTYYLWARVRSADASSASWTINLQDESTHAATEATVWTWVLASPHPLSLEAGQTRITFATHAAAAQLDLVCLTTDPAFQPQGARPEKTDPPPAPSALTVENILERANRVSWDAVDDPSLSHYNVYVSEFPITTVRQEFLRGSPSYPWLIDWGLKADTQYYYAVTAVDRRGNESEAVFGHEQTPASPREEVVMELTFAEADTQGPFERSEAGGMRAPAYLVPKKADENSVSWTIDVPEDGDYYFWLRYLHRGPARRGGEVNHRPELLLNGKRLMNLGSNSGRTDLAIPDEMIVPGHPLADQVWTWAWPSNRSNLQGARIPAGRHTLTLTDLNSRIRYDVLLMTNDPAYLPTDGRFLQAL